LNIHSVKSFELLEQSISSFNEDSLIVFDIDETILYKKDRILRTPLGHMKYADDMPFEDLLFLFGRAFRDCEQALTDSRLLFLIDQIKKQKAKIIALTFGESGRLGVIESFPEFRVEELNRYGVDFSSSFPELGRLEIPVPIATHNGKLPLFYNGIICANRVSKEIALESFLAEINWLPKKLVFIDDFQKYVFKIQKFAEKKGIEYLGLHYVKVREEDKDLNYKIADIQFEHLKTKEIWLSDYEARKVLEG
jgi:hypothetical protein